MQLHRTITPNGVAKRFLAFIACLIVCDLLAVYFEYVAGFKSALGFVPLFDMDVEYNIPSLYSTIGIFINALILFYIARIDKSEGGKESKYWKAMGWVFVYLSLDELASIHEHLDAVVTYFFGKSLHHHGGPLWILPYSVLLIFFGLYFIRFYLRLPNETKLHFCIAGVVYVSGAVGVEILGNPFDNHPLAAFIKGLYSTLEETMEMVGMVLFLRALLSYIVNHTRTENHGITLHFQDKNSAPTVTSETVAQDLFVGSPAQASSERQKVGV